MSSLSEAKIARIESSAPGVVGLNSAELAIRVRKHVVMMTSRGGSSHVASGLSIADILAVLYTGAMNVRAHDPGWRERDRFILSKGHAGAAVYATLAEVGFFPVQKLQSHYQDGSDLSGHVSHKGIPGVELSTGSLGHGLSVATGIAHSLRLKRTKSRVFCLLSDGEYDEGSNWEAMLFGAHHKLSNLLAIIDYNKLQSLASITETLELEPLVSKFKAFCWEVREIDGHDHEALRRAFSPATSTQPVVVIAHTVKGRGVSFMENSVLWHYRSPKGEELTRAIAELGGGAA